jgi:uncharacterized protein (DUF342 family)
MEAIEDRFNTVLHTVPEEERKAWKKRALEGVTMMTQAMEEKNKAQQKAKSEVSESVSGEEDANLISQDVGEADEQNKVSQGVSEVEEENSVAEGEELGRKGGLLDSIKGVELSPEEEQKKAEEEGEELGRKTGLLDSIKGVELGGEESIAQEEENKGPTDNVGAAKDDLPPASDLKVNPEQELPPTSDLRVNEESNSNPTSDLHASEEQSLTSGSSLKVKDHDDLPPKASLSIKEREDVIGGRAEVHGEEKLIGGRVSSHPEVGGEYIGSKHVFEKRQEAKSESYKPEDSGVEYVSDHYVPEQSDEGSERISYKPENNGVEYVSDHYVPEQGDEGSERISYKPEDNGVEYVSDHYVPEQNEEAGGERISYKPEDSGVEYVSDHYVPEQNDEGGERISYKPENNGVEYVSDHYVPEQNEEAGGERISYKPENNGVEYVSDHYVPEQNEEAGGERISYKPENNGVEYVRDHYVPEQNEEVGGERISYKPQYDEETGERISYKPEHNDEESVRISYKPEEKEHDSFRIRYIPEGQEDPNAPRTRRKVKGGDWEENQIEGFSSYMSKHKKEEDGQEFKGDGSSAETASQQQPVERDLGASNTDSPAPVEKDLGSSGTDSSLSADSMETTLGNDDGGLLEDLVMSTQDMAAEKSSIDDDILQAEEKKQEFEEKHLAAQKDNFGEESQGSQTKNIELGGDSSAEELSATEEVIELGGDGPASAGEEDLEFEEQEIDEDGGVELGGKAKKEEEEEDAFQNKDGGEIYDEGEEFDDLPPEIKALPRLIGTGERSIRIFVEKDKMTARLVLYPDRLIDVKDVKKEFGFSKLRFGIDTKKAEKMLQQMKETGKMVRGVKIAQGKPAVHGEDAYFDAEFTMLRNFHRNRQKELDPEKIYDMKLFNENEEMGVFVAAKKAEHGKNVYGETVEARTGNHLGIKVGDGARYDKINKKYFSKIQGQPVFDGSTLKVIPVKYIEEDFSGELEFEGSVFIEGNVVSGSKIKVTEDLKVSGRIEDSNIEAGGMIVAQGGFSGSEDHRMKADKGMILGGVEGGVLESEQDLLVQDFLVDSDVTVKGTLFVLGGEGKIEGGTCRAVKGVECINLGKADKSAWTQILVGEHYMLKELINSLNKERKANQMKLLKIREGIEAYVEASRKGINLNAAQKNKLKTLRQLARVMELKEKEFGKKREKLLALYNRKCKSEINVRDQVYPNINLHLGSVIFKVEDEFSFCSFSEHPQKASVRLAGYNVNEESRGSVLNAFDDEE